MTDITPSPEQQLVIEHGPGPPRVIAGAGAGKTLTMAKRLVELIRNGV